MIRIRFDGRSLVASSQPGSPDSRVRFEYRPPLRLAGCPPAPSAPSRSLAHDRRRAAPPRRPAAAHDARVPAPPATDSPGSSCSRTVAVAALVAPLASLTGAGPACTLGVGEP